MNNVANSETEIWNRSKIPTASSSVQLTYPREGGAASKLSIVGGVRATSMLDSVDLED